VSEWGKCAVRPCTVSIEEMSTTEPPLTYRKYEDVVETGDAQLPRDEVCGESDYCADGNRYIGGMTLVQALLRNMRTCISMQRESGEWRSTSRVRIPRRAAGAEQPVVVLKRL
jgi:hypothetical protein